MVNSESSIKQPWFVYTRTMKPEVPKGCSDFEIIKFSNSQIIKEARNAGLFNLSYD